MHGASMEIMCLLVHSVQCFLKFGAAERMENIWTDLVRNKLVHGVKEDRNILRTIKRRESDWVGHILHRNCLLKRVVEG